MTLGNIIIRLAIFRFSSSILYFSSFFVKLISDLVGKDEGVLTLYTDLIRWLRIIVS